MSEIKIRKFESRDITKVKTLIQSIMKDEFPEVSQAYPYDDLKNLEDSYGKLGEAFFVAASKGKIIGTVGIKQEDERTALLRRLFVDAKFRGKRLGDRLIERAITFCREVGYEELIFKTTSTMHNAVLLGKKKGFVPKARINLGPIDLLKFALRLKSEAAA